MFRQVMNLWSYITWDYVISRRDSELSASGKGNLVAIKD